MSRSPRPSMAPCEPEEDCVPSMPAFAPFTVMKALQPLLLEAIEPQVEPGVAGDVALTVEVADAGVEQHDPRDGQFDRGRRLDVERRHLRRVFGCRFGLLGFGLAVAARERRENREAERQRDDRQQVRGTHGIGFRCEWGKRELREV